MNDFVAKKLDLDLNLTLLDGTQLKLEPKNLLTVDESMRIMNAWTEDEKSKVEGLDKVNLLAEELAVVYPKDSKWWSSNFDIETLSSIVVFVAETIGGVRKKG